MENEIKGKEKQVGIIKTSDLKKAGFNSLHEIYEPTFVGYVENAINNIIKETDDILFITKYVEHEDIYDRQVFCESSICDFCNIGE